MYTPAHLAVIDRAIASRSVVVTWPEGRVVEYSSPEALRQVRNDIERHMAGQDLAALERALAEGDLRVVLSSGARAFANRAEIEQVLGYVKGRLAVFRARKPVPQRRVIHSPFLA